jgi:copper transport protein
LRSRSHGVDQLPRCLAVLAACAAVVLVMAPSAWAHAALKSVTPADGTTLDAQPASVVIEFSAAIEDNVKEASLLPPTGEPITDAWKADGSRITLTMPDATTPGTWGVEWRVLGGDGHPLTGSTTFVVKGAAPAPSSEPQEPAPPASSSGSNEPSAENHAGHVMASTYPHDALERVALAGRIMFFAGLLLFVGGVLFAVIAAPGWQPRFWMPTLSLAVAGAWIVWGSHAAMIEERSLLAMLNPVAWLSDALSVGVRGYILAAVLLCIVHAMRWQLHPREWEAREAGKPILLLAVLMAAAASPSLSGHASDGNALWLRVPLDMLHVLAGAAWLGGLVQLLTIAKRERSLDPRMFAVVNRYSTIAAISVGVLVITGIYATLDELGAGLGELVGSTWGRLILAKVVLLGATMPLANANRLRNVPDVGYDPVRGVPRLRRFVVLELVIIVWVVGATAMLVYETPPKDVSVETASPARTGS